MRLVIIKEMLTTEQREVVKIFLSYIFLSLPLKKLVTLGKLAGLHATQPLVFKINRRVFV